MILIEFLGWLALSGIGAWMFCGGFYMTVITGTLTGRTDPACVAVTAIGFMLLILSVYAAPFHVHVTLRLS